MIRQPHRRPLGDRAGDEVGMAGFNLVLALVTCVSC